MTIFHNINVRMHNIENLFKEDGSEESDPQVGYGQWLSLKLSSIIHDSICTLVHKNYHHKNYHSDINTI